MFKFTNQINDKTWNLFTSYMLFFIKSFPKLQIIFIFLLIFLLSCSSERSNVLDNEKFIEIYARLLIISEMDINKEYQDRLIGELFRDYGVSRAEIDSSITYFNAHQEEWVEILGKARDKIQEIRKEMVVEEKEPQQIEAPPPTRVIRDTDKKDTRIRRLREKPSRNKKQLEDKKVVRP